MTFMLLTIATWLVMPGAFAYVIARRSKRSNADARFGVKSMFLYLLLPCAAVTVAIALAGASVWDPARRVNALIIAAACVAVAIGALVIPWAFAGRINRRRCPKCRYDMSGDARLCPECGFASYDDIDFFPPERRWRTVVASTLVLVLAIGSVTAVMMVRGDAKLDKVVPAPLVAAIAPHRPQGDWTRSALLRHASDDNADALTKRLVRRAILHHLRADRDWDFAIYLAKRIQPDDAEVLDALTAVLDDVPEGQHARAYPWMWPVAIEHNWDRIVRSLDHHDPTLVLQAIKVVRKRPDDRAQLPALIRLITSEHDRLAQAAMVTIINVPDCPPEAIDALWAALDSPTARTQLLAAQGLNLRDHDRFAHTIRTAIEDPSHPRYLLAGATAVRMTDPTVASARAIVAAAPRYGMSRSWGSDRVDAWVEHASLTPSQRTGVILELAKSTNQYILGDVVKLLRHVPIADAEPAYRRIEACEEIFDYVREHARRARTGRTSPTPIP